MARTTAGKINQKSFSVIPRADIPRSVFNRSFNVKTSIPSAGYLYPIFADEALPGDSISIKPVLFGRLATPIYPIMDNIYLDVHFWACPLRLVWNNFQRFMGEQDNPDDSTDYVVPQLESATGGFTALSLMDFMGIPPNATSGAVHSVSALYSRAYALTWNQWYRDENLQDSTTVDLDDGPDAVGDYPILPRGKRKDYFTSALPWPQKGTAVQLPLGTTAPVLRDGTNPPTFFKTGAAATSSALLADDPSGTGNTNVLWAHPTGATAINSLYWDDPNLVADLSAATAATINEMRMAFQMQRLFERDARGGTRYTELLRSHFNVISPDQRLQRVEYLGGGSLPINVNPVANTTGLVGEIGDLAAFGTITGRIPTIKKSFTEHCVILGLVSVRADLNYQQGVPRQFLRSTKFDFYWPALAHLGEQEVYNEEIYKQGTSADREPFGYQERWAEYRYKPNQITGAMRSTYSLTLDAWHLAQEFGSLPLLNEAFIVENPPMSRVLATTLGGSMAILDGMFQFKHVRPMPTYSVPGLIDHF